MKILDKPCPDCGWRYPGFHICLGLPQKLMQQVEDGYDRDTNGEMIAEVKVRTTRAKNPNVSHRQAISDGVRAKHANDPKRIARDKEIERLYDREELSIRDVSEKMVLSQKTVMSALHRAQDAGRLVVRAAIRRNRAA